MNTSNRLDFGMTNSWFAIYDYDIILFTFVILVLFAHVLINVVLAVEKKLEKTAFGKKAIEMVDMLAVDLAKKQKIKWE
jgi:hypothetical protein